MRKITTLGFICCSLLFIACQDDENLDFAPDTRSTQDNSKSQSAFDDISNIVEKSLQSSESQRPANQLKVGGFDTIPVRGVCATVLWNRSDSLIIDFGTGCTDSYNTTRSGRIFVAYTGGYFEQGSVITTTLENYFVNDDFIEGVKVVTNQGDNSAGQMVWEVDIDNGQITYENGDVTTWESTRYRTLVDDGSILPFDEIYEIYGDANGVNTNGRSYEMNVPIADPLYLDLQCWLISRMPKSGVLTISPEGLEDRVIDYGEGGACDRQVKLSVGSQSIVIGL